MSELKRSRFQLTRSMIVHPIRYLLMLFACCLVVCHTETHSGERPSRTPTKRRHAKMDGDVIIGALFPVHRQPSISGAFTRQCGEIWEQYGIQRVEVMLRTLDEINANPNLLPGITLGCDVRDTCWYPPIALEQSIDFIRNSIASVEQAANGLGMTMGFDNGGSSVPVLGDGSGPGSCASPQRMFDKPIAGLIGPASSTVTMQIQNLLALFHIPQIGYSATALDLSKKHSYPYFLRVVPSDLKQARVLTDIIRKFGWNYISTVYTTGNYGAGGMERFRKDIKPHGICEADTHEVANNGEDTLFDDVIEKLNAKRKARVVVCFCEGESVRGLMRAAKRRGLQGRFMFIGSDGWNVRTDVIEGVEDYAIGSLSIKLFSAPMTEFDEYFWSLSPDNNSRNPWFIEFWQERFGCYIAGPDRNHDYGNPCTGNENTTTNYTRDDKLGLVKDAVYTMAHALQTMLCPSRTENPKCNLSLPISGSVLKQHLFNTSFRSTSGDYSVKFDQNGDPPGARYDIMQYQLSDIGQYVYTAVGQFVDGQLFINDSLMMWPFENESRFESSCSQPCKHGEIKIKLQESCCWTCRTCPSPYHIIFDEYNCTECANGQTPSDNLTICVDIPVEHVQWFDLEVIVAVTLSVIGMATTLSVIVIYGLNNETPIVKASSRELTYMILVGIFGVYASTLPLVAMPTAVTCAIGYLLPAVSFALMYGSLLAKTNRIARILAVSKKRTSVQRLRFLTWSAQVIIVSILTAIECLIVLITMTISGAADTMFIYPDRSRNQLVCRDSGLYTSIIVPYSFDAVLIVACTMYAFRTRNLPENFNETKFIAFTMYTTWVVWIAFIPVYLTSSNKVQSVQIIAKCMAASLSATVALVLLFLPKIYVIVFHPERNVRSSFTTADGIRCHVGVVAMGSFSIGESTDGSVVSRNNNNNNNNNNVRKTNRLPVSVISWIEPVIESIVYSAAQQTPTDVVTSHPGSEPAAACDGYGDLHGLTFPARRTRMLIDKQAINGDNSSEVANHGCDRSRTEASDEDLLADTKGTADGQSISKTVADNVVCSDNVSLVDTVIPKELITASFPHGNNSSRPQRVREAHWRRLPAYVISEDGLSVQPRQRDRK